MKNSRVSEWVMLHDLAFGISWLMRFCNIQQLSKPLFVLSSHVENGTCTGNRDDDWAARWPPPYNHDVSSLVVLSVTISGSNLKAKHGFYSYISQSWSVPLIAVSFLVLIWWRVSKFVGWIKIAFITRRSDKEWVELLVDTACDLQCSVGGTWSRRALFVRSWWKMRDQSTSYQRLLQGQGPGRWRRNWGNTASASGCQSSFSAEYRKKRDIGQAGEEMPMIEQKAGRAGYDDLFNRERSSPSWVIS